MSTLPPLATSVPDGVLLEVIDNKPLTGFIRDVQAPEFPSCSAWGAKIFPSDPQRPVG